MSVQRLDTGGREFRVSQKVTEGELSLKRQVVRWLGRFKSVKTATGPRRRGPIDHVVIMDGTMSSMKPGYETNAGRFYRLLCEVENSAQMSIRYEQGVQWRSWRDAVAVAEGRGINKQIRRAYGFIASRYRPGDRIFLIGYSRGAYAVRSLAGVIDQVGLLRAECATVRNIRQAYRHYQLSPESEAAGVFASVHCHDRVEIEMVGVWDTVKALGNRLPVFWRWSQPHFEFHSTSLGPHIRHGFQALAMDETRLAYSPVLWTCEPDWKGVLEQVWFRGSHGDIGGHLGDYEAARPLANIPLVWMAERLVGCGVALPAGWRDRFAMDVSAPSVGTWRGWSKMFVIRRRRKIGVDPSESVHESVGG